MTLSHISIVYVLFPKVRDRINPHIDEEVIDKYFQARFTKDDVKQARVQARSL